MVKMKMPGLSKLLSAFSFDEAKMVIEVRKMTL